MINRNKQQSFTLIELLVVIVIIGILAGVIMISTSSSIDKANIAKLKTFSESIKNNLMLNLVSEWKFDESSGTESKDSWGNSNFIFGTSPNNPAWVLNNCASKNCLSFDGAGDFAKAAGFSDLGTKEKPYTLEGWVLIENGEENGNIIFMSSLSDDTGWCLPPMTISSKRLKLLAIII
ncbi:MAG TPA: type II secretion system protein [Candidatus Pacearchaeota archaeon]|nr:type II secretion system protein [Candidatus Pacearchaeota archaeon]